MSVSFRYAELKDLERIIGTYNASIPGRMATADLTPVTVEDKLTWFHAHDHLNRPLFVVEFNGEYAGWMSFKSFYGRPAYNGTVELGVYLESSFQGKGIAKVCLGKAIELAPSLKIQTLLAFIFAHNIPSLKLFRSFGFDQYGHLPAVANMDGLLRDLIILGKKV